MKNDFYIGYYPEIDPNCPLCGGKGYLPGLTAIVACTCGKEPKAVTKLWRKLKKVKK